MTTTISRSTGTMMSPSISTSLETEGMLRSCTSQISTAPNIIIMLRPSSPIMLSNMRW